MTWALRVRGESLRHFEFPTVRMFNSGTADTLTGQINFTSDRGHSRQIQFGLKYDSWSG